MTNPIQIIKRDGEKEDLNIDKIHRVVEFACSNLAGDRKSTL